MSDCLKANGDTLREHNVLSFFLDNTEKKFVDLSRKKVACENIRFSSLFAVGGVSSVRNVPSGEERGCFRRLETKVAYHLHEWTGRSTV